MQREIRRAQELWNEKLEDDIYLIPARLNDCEIPGSLRRFHWVDLHDSSGFSRLLQAIQVGMERRLPDASADGKPVERATASLKFFCYVSRTKVDMLLPQLRREDLGKASDEPLEQRTLRLLEELESRNLVTPVSGNTVLDAGQFHSCKGAWHTGLFCFKTFVSATVAYFLWRKQKDSLILLAGSPGNVLGEHTIDQGVRLASTGDAIDTIGGGRILETISKEEESSFALRGGIPSSAIPDTQFREDTYTQSDETALALFCLRYLRNLPVLNIETVFRIYAAHSSHGANLFEDLEAEYARGGAEYPMLYGQEGLAQARGLGMADIRTIFIGSPLYTAIG